MTDLDPRLKGLKEADITLKFVRDNATLDEIKQAVLPAVPYRQCVAKKEIGLDNSTGEDIKVLLTNIISELGAFESKYPDNNIYIKDDYFIYIVMEGYEIKIGPSHPEIKGEKALQKIWKEQVRRHTQKIKDLDEYIRLKQKLGIEE